MKELTAIIRSGRWPDTIKRLNEAGFYAVTRQRAYGRGKQKGLRYGPEDSGGIMELPKWILSLIVEEADVDKAVAALMAGNKTGEIGDGKIFVCPVLEAVRIRTDEKGSLALT
jgi:nitrogen regulatory protein PII 2